MRLLVGCPVRRREWCIADWLTNVEAACWNAAVDADYQLIVVADPADPTVDLLRSKANVEVHVVECVEDVAAEDRRDWSTPGRLARMAEVRNMLLEGVRRLSPDLFLSLDSDILLHPLALEGMASLLHRRDFAAVGAKAYMTEVGLLPSYGTISGFGTVFRPEAHGMFQVDVIMAIKLMAPAAYAVDYVDDPRGEDIGWSLNVRKAGLRLGWWGTHPSKHLLNRRMLHEVDVRCGY